MIMQFQNEDPHWFCIHTKPSHEIQATLSLKELPDEIGQNVGGIDIYFPRIKTRMTVGGHVRQVLRPLFPRYFFSRFSWSKAARFISSRPQVIGIVQFGGFPSVVPPAVIKDLKNWSIENDTEFFDPTTQLKAGQRVLIKNGPFKGMEAEFISHLSDLKRVELLLDHLQSQARLILDRTDLTLVP